VIALVVGGATHLLATGRLGFSQKMAWIVGAIVVVFLGTLSWNQSRLYVDDETLWRDTVAKNPTAWLAHYNLGVVFAGRGQLDYAIAAYNEALHYKPDDIETHNNLRAKTRTRTSEDSIPPGYCAES
jgi:tetratricopeptide (TPR) repeat protein